MRWCLALVGLFLLVFALCALSGPGRIDIADGQTRYAVARSLVEHGDSIVRDDGAWMNVYAGRNGDRYTWYRLPQSVFGVLAILAADETEVSVHDSDHIEMRRQFFFSLIGSVNAAILAVCYGLWFRELGSSPRASLLWAFAAIVCTPSWYYSTSSFDDILGTSAVVLAITAAWLGRQRTPIVGAVVAGLAMAWAVNCKEPLGVFVLPVLAAAYRPEWALRKRLIPLAVIVCLMAAGGIFSVAYEYYKFPTGSVSPSAEFVRTYGAIWTPNPLPALAGFAFSTSTGVFFYCPALYLMIRGLMIWWRRERVFCAAVAIAAATFTFFFCFVTFFKGDPSWGPRYLTPVFAVGWLFVPAAAATVRPFVFRGVLALAVLIQLMALSVDPLRLFFTTPVHFAYYLADPWPGFNPEQSHLLQRPREIVEVLTLHEPEAEFSPAPLPTHADDLNFQQAIIFAQLVGVSASPAGREPLSLIGFYTTAATLGIRERYQHMGRSYRVYNSLRPWWISQRALPAERRPVNHGVALVFLLVMAAAGAFVSFVTISAGPRT